jgi:hypothetical protein
MNWKLVGSIYGSSSLKSAHFIMIHYQTWPPQAILVSDSIRNKNCMWWPCLLTDRDEKSNLHRGHSIDASYQVSVVAMFGQYHSIKEIMIETTSFGIWYQLRDINSICKCCLNVTYI